ncbi:hypothetical protein B0H66DRAFT_366977 [Apodospora peruviana]|uniref:Uncharacterized protein n=1 Tax=Apodospora peruviana TaxID=516989 RepID=A0AAE0LZR3_9PEZI|nr:hypothetical protein B0H66DRAFT_366977 [Apodospora peruviana]
MPIVYPDTRYYLPNPQQNDMTVSTSFTIASLPTLRTLESSCRHIVSVSPALGLWGLSESSLQPVQLSGHLAPVPGNCSKDFDSLSWPIKAVNNWHCQFPAEGHRVILASSRISQKKKKNFNKSSLNPISRPPPHGLRPRFSRVKVDGSRCCMCHLQYKQLFQPYLLRASALDAPQQANGMCVGCTVTGALLHRRPKHRQFRKRCILSIVRSVCLAGVFQTDSTAGLGGGKHGNSR